MTAYETSASGITVSSFFPLPALYAASAATPTCNASAAAIIPIIVPNANIHCVCTCNNRNAYIIKPSTRAFRGCRFTNCPIPGINKLRIPASVAFFHREAGFAVGSPESELKLRSFMGRRMRHLSLFDYARVQKQVRKCNGVAYVDTWRYLVRSQARPRMQGASRAR